MLTDHDRADRMAMPLPFIQAIGQPEAAAFMAAFVAWRLPAPLDRDQWLRKVMTLRLPTPLRVGAWSAADNRRAGFFDAMFSKCMNLYGGSGTNADPLALARHPWTLTAKEFEKNYQALLNEDLPKAVDDDRGIWSVTATLLGAVPSAAGIALGPFMLAPGVALGLAGLGIVAAGAVSDKEKERSAARQSAQIKSAFPQYLAIYRKEAAFREKFSGAVS